MLLAATKILAQTSAIVFTTTQDTYWQVSTVEVSDNVVGIPQIVLNPSHTQQTMKGWGTCFNELGWDALNLLPEDQQQEAMHRLFSPTGDLRFTIGRFPVGANDYARSWYSCDEVDGDFDMDSFNIDRDLQTLIPYIKLAQQQNPDLTFWCSPWSPPTWMKTNKHYANQSGYGNGLSADRECPVYYTDQFIMQPQYLNAYCLYLSKFVKAYAEQGIPITALAYQNEAYSFKVYPACSWTASATATFLGDYLGPYFAQHNPDVQLIVGTLNTGSIDVVEEILAHPDMEQYFTAVGVQWEGSNIFRETAYRHPHYALHQTESECGSGTFDYSAAGHTFELYNNYVSGGCEKYTYWNAILKDDGCSTWGWLQNSLIQVNSSTGTANYTPEFYAVKHYTHLIPEQSVILAGSGTDPMVLAAHTPDDNIVIIAGNLNDTPQTITIDADGTYLSPTLQPNSFNTFVVGEAKNIAQLLTDEATDALYHLQTETQKYNTLRQATTLAATQPDTTAITTLITALTTYDDSTATAQTLQTLQTLIEKTLLLEERNFDGLSDLQTARIQAQQTADDQTAENTQLTQTIQNLQTALAAYIATAQTPADITEIVSNPSFTEGTTSWTLANNLNSGDVRAATIQGQTCLNNWSADFTTMNVYQDLPTLPAGTYTLTCTSLCGPGEISDQHAYAIAGDITYTSPVKQLGLWSTEGWETQTVQQITLPQDETIRIGYASTSGGGTIGWFCVTNFNLTYQSTDFDTTLTPLQIALDNFQTQGVDSAQNILPTLTHTDAQTALKTLVQTQQTHTQTENVTASDVQTALKILTASFPYITLLDETLNYVDDPDALYAEAAKDSLYRIITTHIQTLPYIDNTAAFDDMSRQLRQSIRQVLFTQQPTELTDFTFALTSPDVETFNSDDLPTGWDLCLTNGDAYYKTGEHWDGNTEDHYFDSYHSTYGWLYYTGHQTIADLPQGTYRLNCYARASGTGAFVTAKTATQYIFEEIPVQGQNGNDGGQVWQDAAEDSDAKNANNGQGYGWIQLSIDRINVTDGTLTVGFTNDKYITGTEWTGQWFSVDDFSLFYTSDTPITQVVTPTVDDTWTVYGGKGTIHIRGAENADVYNLSGQQINRTQGLSPGLYLVKNKGTVRKVMVK